MNKVFKVIWNEARNAYVVVSEIAKNRGSKSCSTKKLLAMLIATGVMTCASFDVLADEPSAAQTAQSQYVAFAPTTSSFPDEYEQTIDGHKYIYDVANQYWVREGYILVLEQNAKLHTPLSTNGRAADVAYTGGGDTSSILQSVTSLVSASGTVTNMGESLNSINASAYAGVSHSGGTKVAGTWNYIIEDSSWKDSVAPGNYKYGYVDLVDSKLPKGFKTAEDPNTELTWDDTKQCYTYKGNPVDYSNVYVIDGKIGVFTNKDGSKVYTGNVFGKNNEVLMTVKDANNKFYSYWASEVTDPSATMQSYRMADYEKDLSVLLENEKKLYRNDIKEVTLTKDENSATISLLRNGGKAVDGVITVSSGGGTGGSDTFVKISNGTANQTFATGSKVEAIGTPGATTGFKINGVDYTIKSGSGVEITQDATKKTTTITVDGNKTIITDTDTTYTAGAGIEINGDNAISVSKNLTGMQSIKGAGAGIISFDGANVKVNNTTFGENNVVVGVAGDGKSPVQINGESGEITGLNNTKVGYTDFAVNKGKAATEGQLKQVMDEGWKFTTDSGNKTTVKVGPDGTNDNAVTFKGDGTNIAVTNTGKDIKVELKKDLTVDSVKAGDFFMDKNKGVGYADKAYITSSGLNANNQKITGIADGTDDTDAVNVGQLKTVSEVANQGWKLSTNGDAASKVAPGEIVDFSGDKNISVSHNGTKVKVELNDELEDIKSISNGDSRINLNADSISISNGNKSFAITNSGIGMSYITADYSAKSIMLGENGTTISGGLDVAGSKITGVAAGTIAAGSTDAVNGSQLNDVKNSINTDISNKTFGLADDNGTALKQTLDKTIKVKGADGITSTVKDGALEIGLKLQEGSNLVVDSNGLALNTALTGIQSITGAGAGSISFADGGNVKVNDVTIEKGGKIIGVAAGTNDSDAVNVSQLNAVKAEASKKTTLSDGKNTTVTSVTTDGQTDYQVNVAGDLKDITSVSNGASKINLNADSISISNGNKSFAITNSGIGMSYIGADYTAKSIMLGENGTTISGGLNVAGSKITGVAAGTADTDAVNVGQLNAVKETANKGWKLKTNNGNASDVKPGDEVEFDGDDNIKVSNTGNKVSFKLNNKLTGIESIAGVGGGSISFSGGNVTINNNVTFGSNGQIHNVTAGTASTDAVNVGQLNAAVQAGNTDTHIKPGEYGVGADNKVNMDVVDKTGTKINTVTITDVAKASDLGNVNNINNDLKNSNGTTTVVDAVNNLNQKLDNKVGDLQYSKVEKGDIADGDSTTTAIGKLDQALKDVADTANQGWNLSTNGDAASKVAPGETVDFSGDKNISVSHDGTKVKVELNKDIDVDTVKATTVTTGQTEMNNDGLKVGDKVSVTATAVTAGKTSISDEGVKVGNKTYISDNGLNANDQKVTNVAAGEISATSKDAVNGSQLYATNQEVVNNSNRIGQLSSRVNKVGAGAAALAALHPMDFDPDDKLTFSAGYGNYAGQNAAAIGAYYRPDEKVMFSVGGTVGNGENMVNAGISFSLDRTNHVSNSRTALAREVIELRGQLAEMGAKMARMEKAFGMLDESKTKLFPDIPANHWAYEYIAELAGNGILEGYPDGSFGGDRLMTRYEFATMLYRAIENGAALEERIIKEFEPELGRIRVDRISGEDGDRNKIERVRVNATKGERDHYGNKLAK
ncbi:ESPR-type extended signal peptide-containing protein [Phascolarctobacterium succinatutens]